MIIFGNTTVKAKFVTRIFTAKDMQCFHTIPITIITSFCNVVIHFKRNNHAC